jgi:hypothetical protein
MPSHPQGKASQPNAWRLLLFVLSCLFLANVAQWAILHALHLPNPGAIKPDILLFLHIHQWTDSWVPMMKSLDYFRDHPQSPIYAANLYDTLIYPLPSLLPMLALRKLGVSDPAMLRILAITTWLSVIGIAVITLAMGRRLLRNHNQQLEWPTILAVFLGCIGFYPILKAFSLGNAQAYLSFLFTLMIFLWVTGRERSAGAVAGLLCCVKPQFVLILIWMAVRKRWGAAIAFLACAGLLFAISIAVFGWHNNLDYLGVLSSLSRKAQSHYQNQSMFGTLNRMIFNGENITYTPYVYTPYIPWVYRTTTITSLIIVGAVLFFPWRKLRGSAADLGAMGIASVAASPMAWEDHYGITFIVFAWVWFAYACWQRRNPWLLAICFFCCSSFLASTNLLANKPVLNLAQSYIYIAALLLIGLLMRLARAQDRGEPDPVL